jgi:hypothetical protein
MRWSKRGRASVLIHFRNETAARDKVLLKDRPIQLTVVLWGMLSFVLLFRNRLQWSGVIK